MGEGILDKNFRKMALSEAHFGGFSDINTAWNSLYRQMKYQKVINATWMLAGSRHHVQFMPGCGLIGGRGVRTNQTKYPWIRHCYWFEVATASGTELFPLCQKWYMYFQPTLFLSMWFTQIYLVGIPLRYSMQCELPSMLQRHSVWLSMKLTTDHSPIMRLSIWPLWEEPKVSNLSL